MRAAAATGRSRAPLPPLVGRRAPAAPPSAAPNVLGAAPNFPSAHGVRTPHVSHPSHSSRAAGGRFQRFNQGNPKQKENEAADSEFVTAVFTYTAQAAAAEAAEKTEEKAAPAALKLKIQKNEQNSGGCPLRTRAALRGRTKCVTLPACRGSAWRGRPPRYTQPTGSESDYNILSMNSTVR